MHQLTSIKALTAAALLLTTINAQATVSCGAAFSGLGPDDPIICVDAVHSIQNGSLLTFSKANQGTTNASIDGVTIFPGPPPSNLQLPFDAATNLTINGPPNDATSFQVHSNFNLASSPGSTPFSQLQIAAGTLNRHLFTPTASGGGNVSLEILYHQTFEYLDPTENASTGRVIVGGGVNIFGSGGFLDGFNGWAELDTAGPSPGVGLFGDYFGNATVTSCGVDCQGVEVSISKSLVVPSGERIDASTNAFGEIFADGFESGDLSAWSITSPDSTTITFSSPDPTVRFNIVSPIPVPGMVWLFSAALAFLHFRRR